MRLRSLITAAMGALVTLSFAERASAHLHPGLGRFMQRDPLGYLDGASLYQYLRSQTLSRLDASGAASGTVTIRTPGLTGIDVEWHFDANCGFDGLTPQFFNIGGGLVNVRNQLDELGVAVGVGVGYRFEASITPSISSRNCPPNELGKIGVLTLKIEARALWVGLAGFEIGILGVSLPGTTLWEAQHGVKTLKFEMWCCQCNKGLKDVTPAPPPGQLVTE